MDKEQRRAQILGIAAEVFAEKGYHEARIEDVVARAGVARGTFYLYFEDKRAVFTELVDRFTERLSSAIVPIELEEPGVRPFPELRANLLRVAGIFLDEPALAKILLSAAVGVDAEFDQRLLAFYDEVTALVERSLEQGAAVGILRAGPTRIWSYCLVGLIKELLYQLLLRQTKVTPEELVDAMMDLLALGLFAGKTA